VAGAAVAGGGGSSLSSSLMKRSTRARSSGEMSWAARRYSLKRLMAGSALPFC
jgi:hypothetical protein